MWTASGLADLLYIDDRKVTALDQSGGNGWSESIEVPGTPAGLHLDAVRLVDLLGSGISGVALDERRRPMRAKITYFFLDLTGGIKPS